MQYKDYNEYNFCVLTDQCTLIGSDILTGSITDLRDWSLTNGMTQTLVSHHTNKTAIFKVELPTFAACSINTVGCLPNGTVVIESLGFKEVCLT